MGKHRYWFSVPDFQETPPVNMLSFIYRILKIFLASQTRQTNKPNSLPDGFSGEIEKILFLPPSNEGRLSNSMQANFKVLPITLGIVSFEPLLQAKRHDGGTLASPFL